MLEYASVKDLGEIARSLASVVYSPHHIGLIGLIANVQSRFTNKLSGMNDISYSHRLELCNLEVLELLRLYADLMMMYKI